MTEAGNSACVFVHGFEPYIYVESPTRDFGPDECRSLQHHVNVRRTPRFLSARRHLQSVPEWSHGALQAV